MNSRRPAVALTAAAALALPASAQAAGYQDAVLADDPLVAGRPGPARRSRRPPRP
jgi:hypothetical protein